MRRRPLVGENADPGALSAMAPDDTIDPVLLELAQNPPPALADTSDEGDSDQLARENHSHAHGARSNPLDHAVATDTDPGFMPETAVQKLAELDPAQQVPAGGSTGQVLKKVSDDDFDVEWAQDNTGDANGTVVAPAAPTVARSIPVWEDDQAITLAKSNVLVDASDNVSGVNDLDVEGDANVDGALTTGGNVNGRHMPTDGTKLDGIATGAAAVGSADPQEITDSTNAPGNSTASSRQNHQHAHGNRGGGALHATAVAGGAAGFISGANQQKLDGISPAAAALSGSAPPEITDSGATLGAGTTAARSDHSHPHGARAGGNLHAVATPSVDGFMSSEDKTDHDASVQTLMPEMQEIARSFGADVPTDGSRSKVLWQVGPARWRFGVSTEGFAQPFFYCEEAGSFGDGGTCELYVVVGAPTSGSTNNNFPSPAQVGAYRLSDQWDLGIPIDGGEFIQGARIDIWLLVYLKVAERRTMYLTLDPDGDVRHKFTYAAVSGAAPLWKTAPLVKGHESGVSVGTHAIVSDDGSGNALITLTAHDLFDDDPIWLNNALPFDDDAEDGLVPDLDSVEGNMVYVVEDTDDTFKVSRVPSTDPGYPDLVGYTATADTSNEVLVTITPFSGSHKRLRFAWDLETTNSILEPALVHVVMIADGAGTTDTEYGVTVFADLFRSKNAEQVGDPEQFLVAREGTGIRYPTQHLCRTRPGANGVAASATNNNSAPLYKAKQNYDGAGTNAYIPSWHDYGGHWTDIQIDVEINPTGSLPLRSYKDDYSGATTTYLEVGGVVVAEVWEYFPKRKVLRVRDLSNVNKVKSGDTVTWKTYLRVGSTWNETAYNAGTNPNGYRSGTFTAGVISAGLQPTNLGVRFAMSGAQDGETQGDVRCGLAVLTNIGKA